MVADAVGGTLTGHKVACWGIAYKAGTDDTRESPAIAVMNLLTAQGADVWAYDPIARVPDGSAITQKPSALEALENADVLVVLTEWSDFAAVDAREALAHLKSPAVIDTRNVLSHDKWRSAGAFVRVLGRPQ